MMEKLWINNEGTIYQLYPLNSEKMMICSIKPDGLSDHSRQWSDSATAG